MKRVLFFMLAVIVAASCGTKKEAEQDKVFKVGEILAKGDSLANDTVFVTGIVDHVCKHGGKKMFLVGSTEDERLRIDLGEGDLVFKQELIGSTVTVKGTLVELRIDNAYLDKWEQEVKADSIAEAASKVHMGEPGHEQNEGNSNADIEKINDLRAQVKASTKGYVSFFSVDCLSYTTEPEKK